MFCHHFTKGNNFCDFLFAFMDEKALSNESVLKKKEFDPRGVYSYLLELTPAEKGDKFRNGIVGPPKK